eukprot:TRINITY_DN70598_c0_g1_i1.p1 TRINITY_DN70598_c0_g1~~TRINITY_DN70598_c0_g1_i1.p1  ORF type:complete len:402 (-),score=53.52 TRINITY_DN70598_c0_g1_i1:367-1452(-)
MSRSDCMRDRDRLKNAPTLFTINGEIVGRGSNPVSADKEICAWRIALQEDVPAASFQLYESRFLESDRLMIFSNSRVAGIFSSGSKAQSVTIVDPKNILIVLDASSHQTYFRLRYSSGEIISRSASSSQPEASEVWDDPLMAGIFISLCSVSSCISMFFGLRLLRLWHQARNERLAALRLEQANKTELLSLPVQDYVTDKFEATECSLCLADFEDGDKLRPLPCGHIFHQSCIDEWFEVKHYIDCTCPLCRTYASPSKNFEHSPSTVASNSEITENVEAISAEGAEVVVTLAPEPQDVSNGSQATGPDDTSHDSTIADSNASTSPMVPLSKTPIWFSADSQAGDARDADDADIESQSECWM